MSEAGEAILRPTDAAYRRRIELRVSDGRVAAAMEDYIHHFAVSLAHDGEVVTAVEVDPERVPWSTCPEGAAGLRRLVGVALAEVADIAGWMGGREHQCVHTVDLAVLAAAAAVRAGDRTYEVWMTGVGHPRSEATLVRDGDEWATWVVVDGELVGEGRFAGLTLDRRRFSAWIETNLGADDREAAFVLRRGATIGLSRAVAMDGWVHPDDARPADGSCLTYAADVAPVALRAVRPRPDRGGRAGRRHPCARPGPRAASGDGHLGFAASAGRTAGDRCDR